MREHRLYGMFSAATNAERSYPGQRHPLLAAGSNTTLRNEDDFSCSAGFEDFFVGARGLGERQLLADDRAKSAVFEAGYKASVDFRFFRGSDGPKSEAPRGGTTKHQVPRVNGDLTAIANDNHASVDGEQLQIGGKVYVGEHLKNNIHAAATGRFQ